jgi:hypothetical protein
MTDDAPGPEVWNRRALCAALIVIVLQQAATFGLAPMSSRWFLHSDDAATAYWGRAILRTGLPRVPYADLPAAHSSPYPVALGYNSIVVHGQMMPHVPLGFLYVMAPLAALGPKALLVAMPLVTVATLLGVYALAARWSTPWLGVLGLALAAFHPAMLFWGAFPRSNVFAIGVLCWGVFLSQDRRPWIERTGLILTASTVVFRYESLPMVAAFFAAWTWTHRGDLRQRWPGLALVAVAGLAFLFAFWRLYGTANFLGVAAHAEGSGFVQAVAASGTRADAWTNLRRFGPLFALAGLACLGVLVRLREEPILPALVLGAGAIALYVLPHRFAPQDNVLYYSQVRYLLPVAVFGAVALAVLWRPMAARLPWLFTRTSAVALAGSAAVAGLVITSALGFATLTPALHEFRAMHQESTSFAPNALFVGSFGDLVADDRPVIQVTNLPQEGRQGIVLDATAAMLHDGYVGYGSELYAGKDRSAFQEDSRFTVTDPPGSHFWVVTLAPA